jgi:hypothetical protein
MSDNFRTEILQEAIGLINGDRQNQYGDPIDDFSTTASLWQTYLERIFDSRGGLVIHPHDVAVLMVLLKVSRLSWSPDKRDHWADIAGYTGCGWDCVQRQDTIDPPISCDYCDNGFVCDCGGATRA